MTPKPVTAWAVEWYSRNTLDGEQRHLILINGVPVLFRTKRQATDWISARYGYLRHRPDLRAEPHGWRMPRAVRVVIRKQEDHGDA